MAQQLLLRYGLVAREAAAAEELPGGFSAIYPALRQMEERGWVRRGMFLSGLADRSSPPTPPWKLCAACAPRPCAVPCLLAAVDPANPYGALLPWPRLPETR